MNSRDRNYMTTSSCTGATEKQLQRKRTAVDRSRASAAHPVGITSERKLVEELRMHLAWRWFTGLGFENPVSAAGWISSRPAASKQSSTIALPGRNL